MLATVTNDHQLYELGQEIQSIQNVMSNNVWTTGFYLDVSVACQVKIRPARGAEKRFEPAPTYVRKCQQSLQLSCSCKNVHLLMQFLHNPYTRLSSTTIEPLHKPPSESLSCMGSALDGTNPHSHGFIRIFFKRHVGLGTPEVRELSPQFILTYSMSLKSVRNVHRLNVGHLRICVPKL